MKKLYKDGRIKILNADYRTMVNEDEKADLILADPPYLLNKDEWDKEFDFEEMLKIFQKSIKVNGNILIFNTLDNIMKMRSIAEDIGLVVQNELMIWQKTNPHPNLMRKNGYTVHDKEYILWLSGTKKPYFFLKVNETYHSGIFRYSSSRNSSTHLCEKPIWLMKDLVFRNSRPGALVFDPFMGSGSVVKACKSHNRRVVAWETDTKWFDKFEL